MVLAQEDPKTVAHCKVVDYKPNRIIKATEGQDSEATLWFMNTVPTSYTRRNIGAWTSIGVY